MKLLLDEHYSSQIALQLRTADYDATTVLERRMDGSDDESLLTFAVSEQRALLTNNVRDFAPMTARWAASGRDHYGLIFSSDESMPRGRGTIGRYVRAVSALMDGHPADDALRSRVRWLR